MRQQILSGVIVTLGLIASAPGAAQPVKDGKPEPAQKATQEQLAKADIVLVGKVTEVGLSVASSFDVGVIEVREVLKGKADTKSVKFRFSSSGGGRVAPYGKKGVEGVWLLDKEGGYMGARGVVSYQPLGELNAIKKLLEKK